MTPDILPPEAKIAIAYAPTADAGLVRALLALDAHFGSILRSTTETILGQMKIAWWRDQLQDDAVRNPGGNELLSLVYDSWGSDASSLILLADGWEVLLAAQSLDSTVLSDFAEGRVAAWLAYAHRLGIVDADDAIRIAAREWALGDLLQGLSDETERNEVLAALNENPNAKTDLPRPLRPLAVLAGLSRRAARQGGKPLMQDRMAALSALRLGIFGR